MINKPIKIQLKGWRNALAHFAVYAIGLLGDAAGDHLRSSTRSAKPAGRSSRAGFGLQSYERILFNLGDVVRNSLVLLVHGCGAHRNCHWHADRRPCRAAHQSSTPRMLDGAFMIPYVMPGIVIGIAYIAAFNSGPLVLDRHRCSSSSCRSSSAACPIRSARLLRRCVRYHPVWKRRRCRWATARSRLS
jgi:iron(III) transport system permease protein